MERLLSQEEIDELLSALHEGQIDSKDVEIDSESQVSQGTADGAAGEKIQSIDLTGAYSSGRWRIANFDIILDNFARNYSISISTRIQRSATVKRQSIETLEFESFFPHLAEYGLIGIMRLDPLKSGGLMVLDKSLCYSLIELMLGSSDDNDLLILDRQVSSIELNILRNIMSDACKDWEQAFTPLEELDTSLVQVESNHRMVNNIMPPDTEIMIAYFSVTIGSITGTLVMGLPYFSLEPYKETLKEGIMDVSSFVGEINWSEVMQEELKQMKVDLSAQFGDIWLSINDILNLREGDIIELDWKENQNLKVLIEDRPKFLAQAGIENGQKAIRITGPFMEGDDYDHK